jgi:hypothetical protein
MKFDTGQIVATSGIAYDCKDEAFSEFVNVCFARYLKGDWGDLCEEDKQENEHALIHGNRLFAAYEHPNGKIYIITEWDRSYTTILYYHEY